jgi:hypothetical protein
MGIETTEETFNLANPEFNVREQRRRKLVGGQAVVKHARHVGGEETHNQQLPERKPDNRITSGS